MLLVSPFKPVSELFWPDRLLAFLCLAWHQVQDCWQLGKRVPEGKYLLETFHGLKIALEGFSPTEHLALKKSIRDNRGHYSSKITDGVDYLVVNVVRVNTTNRQGERN